mmetsp:Transcript_84507/g.225831  ORF Transcript_84507/g.225831 Transcript_84507/m.225831 type:complete len:239 (-) Transcript_84507:43-759(-)
MQEVLGRPESALPDKIIAQCHAVPRPVLRVERRVLRFPCDGRGLRARVEAQLPGQGLRAEEGGELGVAEPPVRLGQVEDCKGVVALHRRPGNRPRPSEVHVLGPPQKPEALPEGPPVAPHHSQLVEGILDSGEMLRPVRQLQIHHDGLAEMPLRIGDLLAIVHVDAHEPEETGQGGLALHSSSVCLGLREQLLHPLERGDENLPPLVLRFVGVGLFILCGPELVVFLELLGQLIVDVG